MTGGNLPDKFTAFPLFRNGNFPADDMPASVNRGKEGKLRRHRHRSLQPDRKSVHFTWRNRNRGRTENNQPAIGVPQFQRRCAVHGVSVAQHPQRLKLSVLFRNFVHHAPPGSEFKAGIRKQIFSAAERSRDSGRQCKQKLHLISPFPVQHF